MTIQSKARRRPRKGNRQDNGADGENTRPGEQGMLGYSVKYGRQR